MVYQGNHSVLPELLPLTAQNAAVQHKLLKKA